MRRLTILGTGLSLGSFLAVTFVLCALWGLVAPPRWESMAKLWEMLLPGFVWLTPASFLLGVVETFVYGFYVALIFVPLFNYFEVTGTPAGRAPTSIRSRGRRPWCDEATSIVTDRGGGARNGHCVDAGGIRPPQMLDLAARRRM